MSIKLKDNIQNELNGGCESLAGECYFERLRTDSENLHGGKKQKGGSGIKAMNPVGIVDSEATNAANTNLKNILELNEQAQADAVYDGCVGSSSPECVSAISGGGSRKNKKNIYQKMNKMNKMKKTLRRKGGSSHEEYLSLNLPSPGSDLIVPIHRSPTGVKRYRKDDEIFAQIRSLNKNSPPTFDHKWLQFDETASKTSNKKRKLGGKRKKTIRKSRKDKTKKAKKSRKSRKSNRKSRKSNRK